MKKNKKLNIWDVDSSFQEARKLFASITAVHFLWHLTNSPHNQTLSDCPYYYVWKGNKQPNLTVRWYLAKVMNNKEEAIKWAKELIGLKCSFPPAATKVLDCNTVVANIIEEFYDYNLVTKDMKEENHG